MRLAGNVFGHHSRWAHLNQCVHPWLPGLYPCTVVLILAAAILAVPISGRADTLYIVGSGGNIQGFDTATGANLGVFADAPTGPWSPSGMAVDSAGDLFVANQGNNTIEKFTPNGVGSVFANTAEQPWALAFNSAGNLFVASWSDTIQEFTPQGVGSIFASNDLYLPLGIAFDSTGNLYAENVEQEATEEFTPGGAGSLFSDTPAILDATGLAIDGAGNLYETSGPGSALIKFLPNGVGSVFTTNGLADPWGAAFDSRGDLFVSNYGYIEEFASTGGTLSTTGTVFATGVGGRNFIAIEIPEPSTCWLAVMALPFLTFFRRLRR